MTKRVSAFMLTVILSTCNLTVCAAEQSGGNEGYVLAAKGADKESQPTESPLKSSSMTVKITSQGRTATFQLYDTRAAKEFYGQLPLKADLSNFRDAQWMFYPPQKLSIADSEAYHDGKKGELSYYAPWGDVFMLYKDFYARDEMHRLGVGLSGIDEIEGMSGMAQIEKGETTKTEAGGCGS